jgi:hypothetical protein
MFLFPYNWLRNTNHCCELEVSNKEMKIGLIGLVVLQPNYIDNWIRYTTEDRTLNRFINVVSTNPDVYSMQHYVITFLELEAVGVFSGFLHQ